MPACESGMPVIMGKVQTVCHGRRVSCLSCMGNGILCYGVKICNVTCYFCHMHYMTNRFMDLNNMTMVICCL